LGNIVFPKTVTPGRMRENFELYDFRLEREDVEQIDALDRGDAGRTGGHPDTFAYVP
jgi:2,5-diketo-D-gluconate reductase A